MIYIALENYYYNYINIIILLYYYIMFVFSRNSTHPDTDVPKIIISNIIIIYNKYIVFCMHIDLRPVFSLIFYHFFPGLCTPFIHTGDTTTSLIIGLFEFSHHHHRKTLWNSKFYIRNHSLHVWNWECHYRDLCLVSRFQAPYSRLAGYRYVCKSKNTIIFSRASLFFG